MGLISRVSSRTYRKKFGTRPNKKRTMAVGKNKRLNTKSKKGGKKKVVDPFIKKEWFDVKAPNMFKQRNIGKTLVTKTIGNKVAADGLEHRVYDINQEDLQGQDGNHFRKFRLVCEDVQGKNCLTNFHGMGLVREKHTMISAHCDVRTTDNFQLRLFVVGFTAKDQKQVKGTTCCQSHQAKSIRKIMVDTMQKTASSGDIQNLVKNLLVDTIASDITKQVKSIYPLENVHVQKVKTIKRPKLDLGRLAELHGQSGVKTNAKGEKVERADHYEPAVQETV